MIVYYCDTCKNIFIYKDGQEHDCEHCNNRLYNLHITMKEWNSLSEDDMREIIESISKPRINFKPVNMPKTDIYIDNIENIERKPHKTNKKRGKRRKTSNVIRYVAITGVAVLLCVGGFFALKTISKGSDSTVKSTYTEAKKLSKEGKYDEAIKKFLNCSDYKDSKKQAKECLAEKNKPILEQVWNTEIGETVEFGQYGTQPISWIVLEKDEEKILLITEASLSSKKSFDGSQWQSSDMQSWLNGDFIFNDKNFTVGQRETIIPVIYDGQEYSDKVTLPSENEIKKYESILVKYSPVDTWLRTKAGTPGFIMVTKEDGTVDRGGRNKKMSYHMRPMMCVAGPDCDPALIYDTPLAVKGTSNTVVNVENTDSESVVAETTEATENKENAQEDKTTNSKYANDVTVTVISKTNIPEDIYNDIYSDVVMFKFSVKNNTNKAIKGVQGKLEIQDLFGSPIKTMECDFTGQVIPANSSVTFDNMSFDVNQFRDEDTKIYHEDFSDLKFKYEVTQIVYR